MSRRAYLRLRHLRSPWITWTGGTCPVAPTTAVTVLYRDGSTARGLAGSWDWTHDHMPDGYQEPDEIVGYRVRQPSTADCGRRAA